MHAPARLGDRSLFPHLEARVYANHAAIAPVSEPVRQAAAAVVDDYARRGSRAFPTWQAHRLPLREALARVIGAESPTDIALAPNTTSGVLSVAWSLPWRQGERIVVFEGEFPANVTPWQQAAAHFGLELVWLRAADFSGTAERGLLLLEAELTRGVRLVAVSAVQFSTGLRMPLRQLSELCHARGAELFVDGVQACGAVPLDVRAEGIDYLSCGAHKWLMGLEGAGFLYVAPERLDALVPRTASWMSHEESELFLTAGRGHLRYDRPLRRSIDWTESGTSNPVGFAALAAAVALLEALGVPAIFEHVGGLLDELERGLSLRGFTSLRDGNPERRSCILAVEPPAGCNPVRLRAKLDAAGVICGLPDGNLRFAPHWPSSAGEVSIVLDAIDAALTLDDAET